MFSRVHANAFNQNYDDETHLRHRRRAVLEQLPEEIRERTRRVLQGTQLAEDSGFWSGIGKVVGNWGGTVLKGAKAAASHVGAQIATKVALALPTTMAGPAGLILGQAVASGLDYIMPDGTETPHAPTLSGIRARDWVAIDRGIHKRLGINEDTSRLVLEVDSETNIGSPEMGIPKRELCLGFVTGPGPMKGTWDVFCLTTARVEMVRVEDLRAPTPQQQAFLQGSELADTTRELFFTEGAEMPTLQGVRATLDPGSEVVLEGRQYHVVTASGSDVLVEDPKGTRLQVQARDLTRGRADHDLVWNYGGAGTVTPEGFTDAAQFAVHRGRFVWMPVSKKGLRCFPTARSMLGVVQRIDGDAACVYSAFDGSYAKINLVDVVPCEPGLCDALSGIDEILTFKVAVAEGGVVNGTEVGARSRTLALITLGVLDGFRAPGTTTAGQLRERVLPMQRNQGATRGQPVEEAKTQEAEAGEPVTVGAPSKQQDLVSMLDLADEVDPSGNLREAATRAAANPGRVLEEPKQSSSQNGIGTMIGVAFVLYILLAGE